MATVDVSLSFNNNIISPNISDPFTITVTNNSSTGIKIFSCKLVVVHSSVEYQVGPEYTYIATSLTDIILPQMGAKTLKNDQFRSYQANGTSSRNAFDCLNTNNLRVLQVKVRYQASDGQNIIYASGAINVPNVYAINKLIVPKIANLAFSRCNDQGVKDTFGTKLLTTLKTSFGSPNDRSSFRVVITQNGGNAVTIPAGDSRLNSFYNGITDSNMFISNFTVNENQKYNMIVQLTDGYESSSMSYTVPSSFVNVHLSSATNGGVAFGKLSSAGNNTPKFECEYPVYLASTLEVSGNVTLKQKSIVLNAGNIYIKGSDDHYKVTMEANGNVAAAGNLTVAGNATIGGDSSLSTINGTAYIDNLRVNPDSSTGWGLVVNGNTYYTSNYISIVNTNIVMRRPGAVSSVFTFDNNGFHFSDPVELSPNMSWVNIPLSSGTASPGTWGGGRLRVGKVGNHVYISGSFNATSGDIVGIIPEGYRPPSRPNTTGNNYYSIRPCGGARIARVYVKPDGELTLEWVRNLSDGSTYTSNAVWVDCNFDYWLD